MYVPQRPATDVPILMQRVLENLKPNSPAYGWAMDLARTLNQTEPCKYCEGKGHRPKHINCHHGCEEAWLNGCNESKECRHCKGCGVVYKKVSP